MKDASAIACIRNSVFFLTSRGKLFLQDSFKIQNFLSQTKIFLKWYSSSRISLGQNSEKSKNGVDFWYTCVICHFLTHDFQKCTSVNAKFTSEIKNTATVNAKSTSHSELIVVQTIRARYTDCTRWITVGLWLENAKTPEM